jgi:hypothetical protein
MVMTNSIVVFTSITRNYLAKATVLARSVKQFHPNVRFHCVVADFIADNDPLYDIKEFDVIVDLKEFTEHLDTPWLFMHALVETSTTLKPLYLKQCIEAGIEKVVYFDPDTRVFSPITSIIDMLENYAVCLTPHIADLDYDRDSIRDNELSAARHGVYNLGFFAVKRCEQGLSFARWWQDRAINYGYAQTFMGSFTDQKICDFVPAYFEQIKIWRHPGMNVAHWNLSQREITCSGHQFYANGEPLIFYHFSYFDSGAGEAMSVKYSQQNRQSVDKIWRIYKKEIAVLESYKYEDLPWTLATFDDGSPITTEMRLYYRQHEHLQYRFPNPFCTIGDNYLAYWKTHSNCQIFVDQWQQCQDFLSSFRFARTDAFLNAKLSAVSSLPDQFFSRIFIYGANRYGQEVFDLVNATQSADVIVLDRDTSRKLGMCAAQAPDDFRFSGSDVIVICGLAHEESMREAVTALCDGTPTII